MKTYISPPEDPDFFSKHALVYNIGVSLIATAFVFGVLSEFAIIYAFVIKHIGELLQGIPYVNIALFLFALAGALKLAQKRVQTSAQTMQIIIDKEDASQGANPAKQLGGKSNAIIILSCLIVYGISGVISYFGTIQGIETAIVAPTPANTSGIDSTTQAAKATAIAAYNTAKSDIASAYDAQIAATKKQYNAKIYPIEAKKKGASATDKKWLQTKINPIKAERDEALNRLRAEKSQMLIDLASAHQQELNLTTQQAGSEKKIILDQSKNASDRHEWFINKANGYFPIIVCIALFLGIVGTYLKRRVMKLSGMTETYVPDDSDLQQNPALEFIEAIMRRIRIKFRMLVNSIDATTSDKWDNFEYKDPTTALIKLQINGRFKQKDLNIGTDKTTHAGFTAPKKQPQPEPAEGIASMEDRKRRLAGFNRYKERTSEDAHNMHTVGFGEKKTVYTEPDAVYTDTNIAPEDLLNTYKVHRRDYVAYRGKTDSKPETIQAGMKKSLKKMEAIETELNKMGYLVVVTPRRIYLEPKT